MSSFTIALLLALGISGWIYSQLQNRSGQNTRQSLIATSVAGALIFIFALSILSLIF